MATYKANPVGDFKPIGALAGVYAGENTANQELQNRMANLADLFDLRQKGITADTGEFELGEKRYKAPSERLTSDVAGRFSQAQLDTPGYFQGRVAGVMGEDQTKAATGAYDTSMLPSKTAAGLAANVAATAESGQKAHITALENVVSAERAGGKGRAMSYILEHYTDPKQRELLLTELQNGTAQKMLESYAYNNPTQLGKMQEIHAQGQNSLAVANATARSYEYSANKNYEAAIAAAEKGQLATAIAAAKYSADAYKAAFDEVQTNLDMYRKEDQQKPEYKLLLKKKDALREQMTEAANLLVKMSKEPMREIPAPTGKGAGSSSTTITSKQANPPAKVVITDEMLASGPQTATAPPVTPPPAKGTYRIVQSMGGDQAVVMLNNGDVRVQSQKQLQSYGFKPE